MTQAATAKGVSQPGLSRVIRELESQSGATLLRRTGRGVELTPAGSAFLDFARDSLAALDDTRQRIRGLSGAMPSHLRIAVPSKLGGPLFPELYRRFLADLPEVTVFAEEALSEDIAEGFLAGRHDFALSYLSSAPGAGDGKAIFREYLYLVGRPDEIGVNDRPIELKEAASLPIILNARGHRYRRLIEAAFAEAGAQLTVAREVETADGLVAFATEGEGVGILPYSNVKAFLARGDIAARPIIVPRIERWVYLLASRQLDALAVDRAGAIIQRCARSVAQGVRWIDT